MKTFNTTGKTVNKVIMETNQIIDKHEIHIPDGTRLWNIRKYQDCTAIIEDKDHALYVNCLFDIYGPFKDFQSCINFRRIININAEAHHQAMVSSWSKEGDGFCTTKNAYA